MSRWTMEGRPLKETYKYVSQDLTSELSPNSTCIEDTESLQRDSRYRVVGHTIVSSRRSHI
jgi:hypothetical protein